MRIRTRSSRASPGARGGELAGAAAGGGRVPARLGRRGAACAGARVGLRLRLGVQREGSVQLRAHVLAHTNRLELGGLHLVQQPAGLLGALGRVLGQIAGDLARAPATIGERAHVELVAPAHARPQPSSSRTCALTSPTAARIACSSSSTVKRAGGRAQLVARGSRAWRDPAGRATCKCTRPRCWYSATFTYAGVTHLLGRGLRQAGVARDVRGAGRSSCSATARRPCCSTGPRRGSQSTPGTAARPDTGRPRRAPRHTTAGPRARTPVRRAAAGKGAAARPGRSAASTPVPVTGPM